MHPTRQVERPNAARTFFVCEEEYRSYQSSAFVVAPVSRPQKVCFPTETARVRGGEPGAIGGSGAVAARDVRLQQITSSSPPLFSFAHGHWFQIAPLLEASTKLAWRDGGLARGTGLEDVPT